jgi:hypothetical protein
MWPALPRGLRCRQTHTRHCPEDYVLNTSILSRSGYVSPPTQVA